MPTLIRNKDNEKVKYINIIDINRLTLTLKGMNL